MHFVGFSGSTQDLEGLQRVAAEKVQARVVAAKFRELASGKLT